MQKGKIVTLLTVAVFIMCAFANTSFAFFGSKKALTMEEIQKDSQIIEKINKELYSKMTTFTVNGRLEEGSDKYNKYPEPRRV